MTPEVARTDVLIIGAGPVGLTLANELRKREVDVHIVEKLPAIREISKALIWHIRTQEALDKVGILQRGLAEAQPLNEVVMRAYGKRIGSWLFADIDSPNPHAAIIGQNRTQHPLLDLLRERGGDVEWNAEATAIAPDADGVTATIARGAPEGTSQHTIRAKYVVGCEGSNSIVRKTLGLTFEGQRYSGEQFIQADCKLRWTLPGGRSYLFLTDDGYMMVIEMQLARPQPLPQALLAHVTPFYVTTATAAPDIPGYCVLIDGEEHVHRGYSVTHPAFYLLRPDGVVAMRGPGFDLEALRSYLAGPVGLRAATGTATT